MDLVSRRYREMSAAFLYAVEKSNQENLTNFRHTYAITGGAIIAILFILSVCAGLKCYKKFNNKKKASNIHLLNENPAFSHSGSIPLILKRKSYYHCFIMFIKQNRFVNHHSAWLSILISLKTSNFIC